MTVIELRRKAAEAREKIQALVLAAEKEDREVNDEETSLMNDWKAEAESAERRAKLVEEVEAGVEQSRQSQGRQSSPLSGRVDPVASEDDKKLPTGGFRSAGHFAAAIFRGMHPSEPDDQAWKLVRDYAGLQARAATGLNEAADPEGGLLVPPQFAAEIWDRSRDYENLADRVNMTSVSGNNLTVFANAEKSRVNGSRFGGVQSFWAGEAQQYTGSKPTFREIDLKLKKLTTLIYATNEQLEDATALESYINRVAPAELAFKVNDALINGNGAGIPQGVLAADALVTVAAVSGQGNTTIVAQNIADMWARIYAPSRRNGIWLGNQDIEAQLDGLHFATGSSSGQLVYMPPGGVSAAPFGTIKGRPLVIVEQCSTLGTVGDLMFVDFTQYAAIKKASGINSAMSIHLRFDYDETVFKFSFRMDAQPYWQAPLTPFKGSNTQSPFVALSSSRS